MKDVWLTILRDRNSCFKSFREAAHQLSLSMAYSSATFLERDSTVVFTPFQETLGVAIKPPVLVTILRSGLAMLPSFLEVFPESPIGFIGLKRDESTFKPQKYYENIPKIHEDQMVFILDPMLATGGSARLAIQNVCQKNIDLSSIVLIAILASEEAISSLSKEFPGLRILVSQVDPSLNIARCVVPGLGDFGDRYFGL